MSHDLEIRNGEASMFSVREVPWHGLGKIVKEAPTAEEAIKLAGLDWKVEPRPVYNQVIEKIDGVETTKFVTIPRKRAMVRDIDNKVLSVMGNSYTPLQNKDAFGFFDKFIDKGQASFETAGALKDGEVIWVLAKLNKAPIEVGKGDIVEKYLLLSNSHNGWQAVRTGFTPTRVVCQNTLHMALNNHRSELIRVMHGSKVKQNLDNVADIINAMDAKFEATAEQYNFLRTKQINSKDLEKFVNIVFELRPDGTDREKMRAVKMQETITGLFENGAGAHLKSAKGTAWGLYNAATNYLTHMSSKDDSQRLYGNWFGNQEKKGEFAFATVMDMVS